LSGREGRRQQQANGGGVRKSVRHKRKFLQLSL
jgi:hypothetical protein